MTHLPSGCEKRCPGCRHREMDRLQSESIKRNWIAQQLGPELLDGADLAETQSAGDEFRFSYRAKVCLRAQWEENQLGAKWKLGLRVFTRIPDSFKRLEEVIDIPDCPLHTEQVRRVHRVLSQTLPGPEFFPLIYVLISGALVTLVLKSKMSDELIALGRDERLTVLLEEAGVQGFFLNFNPAAGERVLSPRGWMHLWGSEMAQSHHQTLGERLWYGPDSFQQQIPVLHAEALAEASKFLSPRSTDLILDLYSGSGASLKLWKPTGARTLGVELGGEAIRCAIKNVGEEVILRGRTSDRIPQLREWLRVGGVNGRRLLFTNPPRLGMEEIVTKWIGEEFRPEKIAYLSCSAGTLARDLSVLKKSGYALCKAIPYDFFPGTHHVEALALLERTT